MRLLPSSPAVPPAPLSQLLLSRIGDTLMLYLLLNASMFAALPNSCCLQLRCVGQEPGARSAAVMGLPMQAVSWSVRLSARESTRCPPSLQRRANQPGGTSVEKSGGASGGSSLHAPAGRGCRARSTGRAAF